VLSGRRRAAAVPVALGLLLILVGAGCAASTSSTSTRRPPAALPPPATGGSSLAAVRQPTPGPVHLGAGPHAAWAKSEVDLYARPSKAHRIGRYPARTPWGGPSVFGVLEAFRDEAGEVWLHVLVARRPNGGSAWVRGRNVMIATLRHRVAVDVSDRRLTVLRGDKVLRTFPVAVGAAATPTPTGRFFVTVKLRPPAISQVYGAWALGLSAYSDVLDQFGTGDGQIALHGTRGTWALGRAVSNGCVRLANDAVSELARLAPPGTPVRIQA